MFSIDSQVPELVNNAASLRRKRFLRLLNGGCVGLAACAALAGGAQSTSINAQSTSIKRGSSVATTESSVRSGSAATAGGVKNEPVGGTTSHLRLMSQSQYFNTIVDLFGADVVPIVSFAPFQRTDGLLATGAAYVGVTESQMELYQQAASAVASRVVSPGRRDYLIPCVPANPKSADNACAARYLSYVGQHLFRRPLSRAKIDVVVGEAGRNADRLGDFYAGLSLVLEGMLISPETFLIREVLEPDPERPGQQRLDAYSLASRLSFFLWNRAPDDHLLKAAASGELYSKKGRARIVDAMLASAKLEAGVRAFFDDMLGFDDFDTLSKDATVYPAFTGASAVDAREQTLRMIVDQLIRRKGDYRDLFTTRDTFISASLAALYREPLTATWAPYRAPSDIPQAGLLTQISFLALHSHPGRTSPTRRGKALRELLLCQKVPDPPPNVDFSAIENPDPRLRTARDRLEAHRKTPACAGCHKITDPIGLALENFDGAGQYRETDKGAPIDTSGSLEGKEFKDAAGLGQVLHDSPAVPSCLVRRVYAYAVGGKVLPQNEPLLTYLNERFAAESYRLPNLMQVIALSNSFSDVDQSENAPTLKKTASASSPLDTTANRKK